MILKGFVPRGKGGAALITAIVFVFFLTLFGLAFYRLGETDIDLFGQDQNLSKALYASEAGIDKVRWMIWESHLIPGANPFSNTYDEEAALTIANPTNGCFFPGVIGEPYFKVLEIQPEILPTGRPGSRVKVQAFGSVDVDADGVGGLIPLGGGRYDPDPDDVNRRFEAYIGLPGTLGERIGGKGISAAARAFYMGAGEVPLLQDPRSFVTPDGDSMTGFLYRGGPNPVGNWHQWGFIFSDPAPTVASGEIDKIELPPGIFDESGDYIDEDANPIPDYFQDLDLKVWTGDPNFTPTNDPTSAVVEGRSVIYFNGDITITGVDFGHLNDQGLVKNCDWEGYPSEEFDLTFIANGDITVRRVDCGNVGRLFLVAKNIILEGDYNTKVNGIAIASNDITLDGHPLDGGSWCEYGILTHQTDFSRPVKYTAYFLGSMVAGNHINLQSDGWTVINDENVINGYMYSTTMLKPTVTYERAEAEDFTFSNNWRSSEFTPELLHRQGIYTQDEISNMEGDYTDAGGDELPEVMRVYTDRDRWLPKPDPVTGRAYFALGETLRLDFPSGVFEDSDVLAVTQPDGSQNWNFYDTITFWMALDNFERTSSDGLKTTQREAHYEIRLRDVSGNTISIPLDSLYPVESEWGTVKYYHTGTPEEYTNEIRDLTAVEKDNGESYSRWKRIKIPTRTSDPLVNFDFGNVEEFGIRYVDFELSWMVAGGTRRVKWWGTYFRYIFEDGTTWRSIDKKDTQGDLYNDPPTPNDGYNYLYDDRDDPILFWFKWIEDPESSTELRLREEVLMPTLRIDRLELPGKPLTNDSREYGLPHCLRLEITNWDEKEL